MNIFNLRITRYFNQSFLGELLKEFFSFIGINLSEKVINDLNYVNYKDDIYLISDKNLKNGEVKVINDSIIVNGYYDNLKEKIVFYDDVLKNIINVMFCNNQYRDDIQNLREIFIKYNLFAYLQEIQNFSLEDLKESNGNKLDKKVMNSNIFIKNMISDINMAINDINNSNSIYSRYSKVYLYYLLNVVNKKLGLSVFNIDGLLEELNNIYMEDNNFLNSYFLSAKILQNDSLKFLYSSYYLRYILNYVDNNSKDYHSSYYIEYGKYLIKVYHSLYYDKALNIFNKALVLNPNNFDAQFEILKINTIKRGDYKISYEDFKLFYDKGINYYCENECFDKESLNNLKMFYRIVFWLFKLSNICDYKISSEIYLEKINNIILRYKDNYLMSYLYGENEKFWKDLNEFHSMSESVLLLNKL